MTAFRAPRPQRSRPPVLTHQEARRRYAILRPFDPNGSQVLLTLDEEWPLKRGTLGAIYKHPHTGKRWLYCINFQDGLLKLLQAMPARRQPQVLALPHESFISRLLSGR